MTILHYEDARVVHGVEALAPVPEFDGSSTKVSVATTSESTAHTPQVVGRTNEQSMGRALRLGALIGIPTTVLVAFMIGVLGGAGIGASVLIGLWVGFGSGTYLAGIFFLPSGPDDSSTTK